MGISLSYLGGFSASGTEVAEQEGRHLGHLKFFRTLGDAISAVVAIDVLKRLVPRIADAAVHLHGPVGGLAAQPVSPVVAHGDLVRDLALNLLVVEAVHLPCGF